jgi:hypothetical protein
MHAFVREDLGLDIIQGTAAESVIIQGTAAESTAQSECHALPATHNRAMAAWPRDLCCAMQR